MKVLITSDWNTYAINGVVTSIKNLTYALRARGHEVKILSLSSTHETKETDSGWEIGSLPADVVYPGARVRLGLLNKTYDKIIAWGPDVIHSQCEMSTFVMAQHIAKECMVPIVHTYHTVYEDYTHYLIKESLPGSKNFNAIAKEAVSDVSRFLSGKCEAMIAPTKKVKTMLEGYDCKCPIYTVPSGINVDKFRQQLSEADKAEMRSALNIKPDEIIALYLGRVAAEKNIDELIKMFPKYKGDKKIKLVIVGGGPYFDKIKQEVSSLNADNDVVLTGMVDPDDTWKYYGFADFFVSASTSETQGLTYIEALSSGLPLLCRCDPCLDDVVMENINGRLFENEEEFLSGLSFILDLICSSGYDRKKIADTAKKFSREHFGSSVEAIYHEAVSQYKHSNTNPSMLYRLNRLIRFDNYSNRYGKRNY